MKQIRDDLIAQAESLRPFFIVGTPKSGTTFLFSLFDGHPAVLTLFETGLFHLTLRREMDDGTFRRKLKEHLDYWSGRKPMACGLDHDEIAALAIKLRRRKPSINLHRICMQAVLVSLLEKIEPERRKQLTHFVEKTPRHYYAAAAMFRAYPEARVTHVLRDPRDNYLALKRLMKTSQAANPDYNPFSFLHDRILSSLVAVQENTAQFAPGYRIVFYEDLLTQQSGLLEPICNWVGLPWDEALLKPSLLGKPFGGNSSEVSLTGKLDAFDVRPRGRWKQELTQREIVLLDQVISAFGLARQYPMESPLVRGRWNWMRLLWRPFEKETVQRADGKLRKRVLQYVRQ